MLSILMIFALLTFVFMPILYSEEIDEAIIENKKYKYYIELVMLMFVSAVCIFVGKDKYLQANHFTLIKPLKIISDILSYSIIRFGFCFFIIEAIFAITHIEKIFNFKKRK